MHTNRFSRVLKKPVFSKEIERELEKMASEAILQGVCQVFVAIQVIPTGR